MFSNKKFIKFMQKSIQLKSDILCVNILDINDLDYRRSKQTMFINSKKETIGFESNDDLKKFVLSHLDKTLLSKKGKYLTFDSSSTVTCKHTWEKNLQNEQSIKCWIEPFYYKNDYDCIGIALKNVSKGISNTLIRSTKFTGAHSFTPNFDEEDNYFNKNKNLFYQRVKAPLKLLILGTGLGCEPLVKIADSLGWQVSVCDTRGGNFKNNKLADEFILLDSYENSYKVTEKYFDAAVVINDNFDINSVYLKTMLESEIQYIGVLGSCKKSKNIIDSFHMQNSIVMDDRLHLLSKMENISIESTVFKICAEIQSRKNKKIKRDYVLL